MLKKLCTFTSVISAFVSKTVFAAGKEAISSSYINVEIIGAFLLAVLALTIYIRVQNEKVKYYENVRIRR